MHIDHHLQVSILEMLIQSDEPIRYSDLKEDDIENSLFSYHLNKLIDRKIVEKRDDRYGFTVEGARWLNNNGSSLRQNESPRVSVALVVRNDSGEYLIGQRTGQFKEMINDYISPTIPYTNNADIADQVDAVVATYIPAESLRERIDYGFTQIKATYVDNAVLRTLFHVTFCNVSKFEPSLENFEWLNRKQIETINHPSATILEGLIDYIENNQNRTTTPTIAG